MDAREIVWAYHEQTKHAPGRLARSPGYLDWSNQPDPFRRYAGAPIVELEHTPKDDGPRYDELFLSNDLAPVAVSRASVSSFLEYGLAVSAWKEFRGARWALRINPSSGNLHPTEGYLVMGPVRGWLEEAGVYHYAPMVHALERRASVSESVWRMLTGDWPEGSFLVGLTSIHWREAWKYGERAYRYCQHDAGHALAALALSAAINGWRLHLLSGISDAEVAQLLGLSREEDYEGAEHEEPDLVGLVIPARRALAVPGKLSEAALEGVREARWHGTANRLSEEHIAWPAIESVTEACRRHVGDTQPIHAGLSDEGDGADAAAPSAPLPVRAVYARRVVFQRRSAVEMDGKTSMPAADFYHIMSRVTPARGQSWWGLGPPACVHLVLFVHRVEGLAPGLYMLIRDAGRLDALRAALDAEWTWARPAGCPEPLLLFRLAEGDFRRVAGTVSCGQAIAAYGAWSCGMIADFDRSLEGMGAWYYRRLFWETGVIGQLLYLEAEAAGVRGTGIGCFFDDAVHELLGFQGSAWQSLYHFAVGGPVEDTRLTSLPPYPHAAAARAAPHS